MPRWMAFVRSILGFASCGRAGEDTSYRLRAEVPAPGEGFDQALSQSLGVTLHAGNRATFVNLLEGETTERIDDDPACHSGARALGDCCDQPIRRGPILPDVREDVGRSRASDERVFDALAEAAPKQLCRYIGRCRDIGIRRGGRCRAFSFRTGASSVSCRGEPRRRRSPNHPIGFPQRPQAMLALSGFQISNSSYYLHDIDNQKMSTKDSPEVRGGALAGIYPARRAARRSSAAVLRND